MKDTHPLEMLLSGGDVKLCLDLPIYLSSSEMFHSDHSSRPPLSMCPCVHLSICQRVRRQSKTQLDRGRGLLQSFLLNNTRLKSSSKVAPLSRPGVQALPYECLPAASNRPWEGRFRVNGGSETAPAGAPNPNRLWWGCTTGGFKIVKGTGA